MSLGVGDWRLDRVPVVSWSLPNDGHSLRQFKRVALGVEVRSDG